MKWFYKLTGRRIVLPCMIGWKRTTYFGNEMKGIYGFRFFTSHGAGTMTTYTYCLHIIWNGKVIFQPLFCWRPDVTHYWLIREPSYRKKNHEQMGTKN